MATRRIVFLPVIALLLPFLWWSPAVAQDGEPPETELCLECHDVQEIGGEEFEVSEVLGTSVHEGMDCIDCHSDIEEVPHEEELEPVDCGLCHDDISELYLESMHGELAGAGEELAPQCWDCHGAHNVLPPDNANSQVTKFNIPRMCAACHKEGTAVTRKYDIPADSVFAHYSQSIHGEGLFQQGLTVTAVCVDCHTAHSVFPHDDKRSSIHRENVANTCQKCHGRIEQVHTKVIRGELWEKEPNKVPACVDCHRPHEIRRQFYEEGIADKECMECHGDRNLVMIHDGDTVSLYVDSSETRHSMHRGVTCAQCHTGATPSHSRPCATVAERVDCSICHSEVVDVFNTSTHGQLYDRGDQLAPHCEDCHGTHDIKGHLDQKSPTFALNVPDLCAECHYSGGPVALRRADRGQACVADKYSMSIHGKGLLESGLVVTAMCTDCHTTHGELPADDPASSVHPANVAQTCATCHNGIYEQFVTSIHSPTVTDTEDDLPSCASCHQSHTISRTDEAGFRSEIMDQCGRCHDDVTESYFETFHGKVSKLGYDAAAKCYDCHGAHGILPPSDLQSTLSRQNIVETCGQCHEGSHRQFAGYLTHATHHDRDKYPILFYTFWFMTILLLGTLTVAGTHTLLWLPRSFQAMRQHRKLRQEAQGKLEYQRFKPYQRRLHILVIISFLGLALTGMTLKFSYLAWAQWLSDVLGGFETAGYIHRVCAVITFFYFFAHIFFVIKGKRQERKTWKQVLFDKTYSMLPNMNDIREAVGTLKWFIGAGPRPKYGRWTYWEKFDYFAVFWGVAIIGSTGLMLWFPEFFTLFLPGWFINVATIIHSDEALLATAFIFTVHFFNTHFRPDKFPMDTVIFTGRVPIDELKQDRPREYAELLKSRNLKKNLVAPLPAPIVRGLRIFGTVALVIGLSLILLIIYAEVFGYR